MGWAQDTKLRLKMGALFGMIACPGFMIWMAGETKRQIASTRWPAVEGQVTGVTVKDSRSKDGKSMTYFGRAVYRYAVQGREYTSDLTDLGPGMKRRNPATALADVADYVPGMKVQVYYDPQDPRVGIVKTGIPPIHLGLLIGLTIATILCAVGSFFTIRGWFKGRQVAD